LRDRGLRHADASAAVAPEPAARRPHRTKTTRRYTGTPKLVRGMYSAATGAE
jgi:hypothetical protein